MIPQDAMAVGAVLYAWLVLALLWETGRAIRDEWRRYRPWMYLSEGDER